jgi:hypothetical protein
MSPALFFVHDADDLDAAAEIQRLEHEKVFRKMSSERQTPWVETVLGYARRVVRQAAV